LQSLLAEAPGDQYVCPEVLDAGDRRGHHRALPGVFRADRSFRAARGRAESDILRTYPDRQLGPLGERPAVRCAGVRAEWHADTGALHVRAVHARLQKVHGLGADEAGDEPGLGIVEDLARGADL